MVFIRLLPLKYEVLSELVEVIFHLFFICLINKICKFTLQLFRRSADYFYFLINLWLIDLLIFFSRNVLRFFVN